MRTFILAGAMMAIAVPAAAQMAATPTPMEYVKKAGAGDKYEMDSSRLVMTSSDPKIRSFAQMMIRDHTKSTAMVKTAAMRAGLHPKPAMLDPMQADMVAKLRAVHGTARDQLYLQQQATAHQQALALHQDYAANGTSPRLKAAAAKIAPVVQHHIDALPTT